MKLALIMICIVGLILALGMSSLPFGETPSPASIQSTIFDGVARNVR